MLSNSNLKERFLKVFTPEQTEVLLEVFSLGSNEITKLMDSDKSKSKPKEQATKQVENNNIK